jgi:protein-tyrosine phosphatase
MIDIHSHILPDLDDGARDMVESVEMARIAAEDGITHMVATPHMFNGLSHNPEPGEVSVRVEALQTEVGDSLRILPGNEVHIAHDLAEKATAGLLTPLNKKSYMLIEFPSMNAPVGCEELFYRLQLQGITPILVHPERNAQIQGRPSLVAKFIEKGVRIQVTAMSVTGEFGTAALKTAETLLRHNCVHFLATDTHRANRRPPILSAGRDAAAEIVGEEAARKLVQDNPGAVVEGKSFDPGPPISFHKAKSKPFLSRLFGS